ncbi:GTP-binding protein [Corynebacterium bovis]|uniref:sulfate adenylyltransferase subunit 1 n=1 Tax=Corynebacterium bovis TaxID=36808 RepID=UPI002447BD8F|nr:GTP-binding protein [Corynebacterium bovis]MDH2456451.1 GTP-binding protein [Corynebacterium bovis]
MTAATRETAAPALPTLRLCTAGSVDDGKSTFVGRLLHDTKSILADQFEAVTRASTARGLETPDLSLLVDGLRAEREQGITIDVAYRYFATDRRSFILADTPGHVQYTRNTVTGMSTSQLVIVLVDARNGVIEQTRRHLTVAAMMDIPQVVVAVNKIDAVDFSADVFATVAADIRELTEGLGLRHVDVVPTSALLGDNVVTRSERTPWYHGPAVLEILEDARPDLLASEADDKADDLRLPVQYVIRDHATDYRGYAGRITSGTVRVGDTVTVGTGGSVREVAVTGIDTPDGEVAEAGVGRSVTLRLAEDIDIARGDLIADATRPEAVTSLTATVVQLSETPVRLRSLILLRYGSALVRARVDEIIRRTDIAGGDAGDGTAAPADDTQLRLNDIAEVRVTLAEPLPVETYRRGGAVGSFLLIDPQTGDTVTAGLVS